MIVLGISALYHDSAAAIVKDNEIIAAAQEERFTRKKHDNSIPVNAINYCLRTAGITMMDVDDVVYYDNPLLTLDRFIHSVSSLGSDSKYLVENKFEGLIRSRLYVDKLIRNEFGIIGKNDTLNVCEHHVSHAASAFYPSPFESAAILTIDGVGEWATTTIGHGKGNDIEIIEEIDYPHSLGLLYSAFTSFCGFKVNSGDYKFMGLAPYGESKYYNLIKDNIIDIKDDGSYRLNLDFFDFHKGPKMTNQRMAELFDGPAREQESKITKREMDIAASVQKITEEIVENLAKHALEITGENNLVMAGGVALNCVANGKLIKNGIVKNIWVQPAAGDAGCALGCALYSIYGNNKVDRVVNNSDSQKGSYLGPNFSDNEIKKYLEESGYIYHEYNDKQSLYFDTAKMMVEDKVIGWSQGRMEYGPRALGNRSIIGNPMSKKMQSVLNLKIKYRESFRPFAPSVLKEKCKDYFELDIESPYMLLCADVQKNRRCEFDKDYLMSKYSEDMLPIVNIARSDIPAVTHVDYSARIQTVSDDTNPEYYGLIRAFEELSGCGVVINTSFNVRGEPIVCTPNDAYKCFMRTEMDVLVLGNYMLLKEEQPVYHDKSDWRTEYALD
ncbi:MAG: carbamoyltransferase [Lachnospiraceae bacterium]|nr:carbamoyltransferase [Lachnospiraceae bacterium]